MPDPNALNEQWRDRGTRAYGDFTADPSKWILAVIVGFVLFAGLAVLGGWEIGWWFKGQNVNRESHLIRNSYSNQQTLPDEITTNIGPGLSMTPQITETSGPQTKAGLSAPPKGSVTVDR